MIKHFLIVIFMLYGCSEADNYKNKTEESLTDNKETCSCFTGIGSRNGDKPKYNFELAQNIKVIACGYLDEEMGENTMSEFNLFNCNNGKSLLEYDARQIARLVKSHDTLFIQELKYLPVGEKWSWKLLQIGEQTISVKDDQIYVSELKPKLEKFDIDVKEANKFLDTIVSIDDFKYPEEDVISKLEVIALHKNYRAEELLLNYKIVTGRQTDGAISETYNDALATLRWIKTSKHK